jgi:DNA repair exonuclease SbcCD ATPase subunit
MSKQTRPQGEYPSPEEKKRELKNKLRKANKNVEKYKAHLQKGKDPKVQEYLNRKLELIRVIEGELKVLELPIQISDHALIRYLERVHGINITQVKLEIINANVVSLWEGTKQGDGDYPIGNGAQVVIRNNVAVTIFI